MTQQYIRNSPIRMNPSVNLMILKRKELYLRHDNEITLAYWNLLHIRVFKIPTINVIFWLVQGQNYATLGPLPTPYKSNSNGTKTQLKLRYTDKQPVRKVSKPPSWYNYKQIKDGEDIIIIIHKTTHHKKKTKKKQHKTKLIARKRVLVNKMTYIVRKTTLQKSRYYRTSPTRGHCVLLPTIHA